MPEPYDHRRLNVEPSGPEKAPPVVLLHGWGSSAAVMRPLARALEDTYRIYNVDLPGHGGSPPPPEPWGVPEHAALVADLIDARAGGGPVRLLGHSNGGRIALYMASDPDLAGRLHALALAGPSGVRRRPSPATRVRRTLARTLKAPFRTLPEGEAKDFLLDWLHHSLLWRALGSSDYRALEGVMRETFVKTVNHYLEDRLPRIRLPVLLLWGTRDEAITREQIRTLERLLPDAGLVELEEAGHYAWLDDFDTFISATRYFLQHPLGERSSVAE